MLSKSPDTGGEQIGSDVVLNNVSATAGIFTVSLDFDASPFTTDSGHYLEIAVRAGGNNVPYTTLTPRQPITSTPYSVATIRAESAATADIATNALKLGAVDANQFVQTTDSRLSDARVPLPDSSAYLQNKKSIQTADFNISGDGTSAGTLSANILNTSTQLNINGSRAFAASQGNTWTAEAYGSSNISSSGTQTVATRQIVMAGQGIVRKFANGDVDTFPLDVNITDDFDKVRTFSVVEPSCPQGGIQRDHEHWLMQSGKLRLTNLAARSPVVMQQREGESCDGWQRIKSCISENLIARLCCCSTLAISAATPMICRTPI
ncbi:MAG: hypothetical protein ACRD9S_00290 [Pyrinomonadaceae bacterium]